METTEQQTHDALLVRFQALRATERQEAPLINRPSARTDAATQSATQLAIQPATAPRQHRFTWPAALAACLLGVSLTLVLVVKTEGPALQDPIAHYEAATVQQTFVMDQFMLACDCLVPNDTPVPGTFMPELDLPGFDLPGQTLILEPL